MAFDVTQFLQSGIDFGGRPLDTKVPLVPACEAPAQITGFNYRGGVSENGPWQFLTITWDILDASVKEKMAKLGVDKPQAELSLNIDPLPGWTPDKGFSFDPGPGKNVQTGRLLESLGLNNGKQFKWSQLMHAEAYIKVEPPTRDVELARFSRVTAVSKNRDGLSRQRKAA